MKRFLDRAIRPPLNVSAARIICLLLAGACLFAGPALGGEEDEPSGPAAPITVKLDGSLLKSFAEADLKSLPKVPFKNRSGKPRTAVRLSDILNRAGVAPKDSQTVRILGHSKEGTKDPDSREFKGPHLADALRPYVLFYNPDHYWTLAQTDPPVGGRRAEHESRVRRVETIEVRTAQ